MDYIKPGKAIPPDEQHRALAFDVPAGLSVFEIGRRLNESGLYYTNLIQGESNKPGMERWATSIEPRFGGITPAFIAKELGAHSLIVLVEPVAWPVEQYFDLREKLSGQRPTLTDPFQPGERVYADDVWRGAMIHYESKPMHVGQVVGVLRGAGFEVATATDLGLIQDPNDIFLFVKTSRQTPTIEELERRLGNAQLLVNKHQSTSDVDFAKSWTSGTNALEEQMKGVSTALNELGAALLNLVGGTADFVNLLATIAVPVAGGLLAWWVYNRFKEAGPSKNEA